MARLTDPEILTCYKNALSNWTVEGYVVFLKDAADGLRIHLNGITPKGFKELLFQHVVITDGPVDQVVERRENWSDKWAYHYDLRPIVDGVTIYVETRLYYNKPDDPDDPMIYLANIKPA